MGSCGSSNTIEDISVSHLRNGPMESIQITCFTWNKDYQGLFDYESKEITKKKLNSKENGIIMKMNKQFKINNQPEENISKENADRYLFRCIKKNTKFSVEPILIQTGNYIYQKSIWLIIRSLPEKKYALKQGDIIKLGRQRIRVKEKILKDKTDDNQQKKQIETKKTYYETLTKVKGNKFKSQNSNNQKISIQFLNKNPAEIIPLCRICLDPGTVNNPLITPCKCSGSMKYIHLICLQLWLGKRLNPIINANNIIINWKPLLCQLCTEHFQYKIYLDNKRYYTVEIPRPPKPYIVLEVLHKDKTKKKVYHLISFAGKNKLNLGRKHDTDVRITEDISVSRNHSAISFDESSKQFFIQDLQSKFGTLALIKKKLNINEKNKQVSIQVGPNVFQFSTLRAIVPPGVEIPKQQEELSSDASNYQEDDEYGMEDQEEQVDIEEQDISPQPQQRIRNSLSIQISNTQNLSQLQKEESPKKKKQSMKVLPVNQSPRKPGQYDELPTPIIPKKQIKKQKTIIQKSSSRNLKK